MADGFFFCRSLARSHLICLQMTAAILLMHSWLLCASHAVLDAHLRRLPPPPGGWRFFFSFFVPHSSVCQFPDTKHLDSTAQFASWASWTRYNKAPWGLFFPSITSPAPLLLQLFSLHLHPPSSIFSLQMGYSWHFCTVDSLAIGFNGWYVDDVTDGGPARDPPCAVMFIAL